MNEFLEIGQIVNTYGIKGYVKVNPFTDNYERFSDLDKIFIEVKKDLQEFIIEDVKYSKNVVLLKLKGIEDINMAENYRNCYIKINRKNAVKLPKDSYFVIDLIGIQVFTDEGNSLGNIVDVFKTGANDVYVVKDEIGKQILLPAIEKVVKQVNIKDKKMIVHLIEGL